ncbi:MAG: serine protease Do [Mariniblastus sp.]|jgi:serine protease Do
MIYQKKIRIRLAGDLRRRASAAANRHRWITTLADSWRTGLPLLIVSGILTWTGSTSIAQEINPGSKPSPSAAASDTAQENDIPKPLSPEELFKAMAATSQAFRDASKKIEPSLVTIESYGGVGAKSGRIGGIRRQGEGNTTGVMISPDGYVLTSTFNFIQQPPVITVITSDGKKRLADLLGRDDTRKICLLKIKGVADMPTPQMVDVDDVVVGQWAVSLGVGYGDTSPAMSIGIISAKNRIGGRAIQTDANISPANYGGPLIDTQGRMLGICVPMNPQSQATGAGVEWYDSGIGFAVPIANAQALIERLKNGEKISPAFLGIQSIANPAGKGLFISRVVQFTAAADAGIEVEDILLAVNGEEVNDMLRLRQILNRFEAEQIVEITLKRSSSDKAEKIQLKLGVPPPPKGEPEEQLEPPKIR